MVTNIAGSLLSLWHSISWNGHTGHFFKAGFTKMSEADPEQHDPEYNWI